MRWNFKLSSYVKVVASSLSALTMCLTPIAQGAEAANQRQKINDYLKATGLTKKQTTVGEYWKTVRHLYPENLQTQVDKWAFANKNELMPKIEATSIKGSNGEQIRLTLSKGGESINLTFTGDEEKPLKYNSVLITKKEITSLNNVNPLLERIAKADAQAKKAYPVRTEKVFVSDRVTLTLSQFKKLTIREKAEYLLQMRLAMEAAQRVYQAHYGLNALNQLNQKHQWAYEFLFGEKAYAASPRAGDNCIVAGYFTVYGEDGSCGGQTSGASDLLAQMQSSKSTCGSSAVACNPLVYGYKESGETYCVSREPDILRFATNNCNDQSKLRKDDPLMQAQDSKRIIESYMKQMKGKNVNLKLDEQGRISPQQYAEISQYLTELNGYIQSAAQKCSQQPLASIKETRIDQDDACNKLMQRATALQTFAGGGDNCSAEMPGSVNQNGKCVCPKGSRQQTKTENGNRTKMCVATAPGQCRFFCNAGRWLLPLGLLLLGVGLLAAMNNDDDNDSTPTSPVYVPPAPGTTGTVSPSPTATGGGIDEPPPAPCPAPNYWYNGVCTAPATPPPETTDSEGGTNNSNQPAAGGIR